MLIIEEINGIYLSKFGYRNWGHEMFSLMPIAKIKMFG
jgi:hypothetical protein